MPIYPFETVDGRTVDIVCPMDQIEQYPLGEWVIMEGAKLKRLFPTLQHARPTVQAEMEVHCMQMPKWLPEAPRWDNKGRAVLLTQKEKKEFAAKTGAVDGAGLDKDSLND